MRRFDALLAVCGCVLALSLFTLTGCSGNHGTDQALEETQAKDPPVEETVPVEEATPVEVPVEISESVIEDADWSAYFEGMNGAAVLFDPAEDHYQIYQPELASTRRSPCSTFKIISSLIALEQGVIDPENSTRQWNGEVFWNEDWNRDISFPDAFRASCVWYFREVIDELGADTVETEIEKLQYGNCDISDWGGRLNTNNSNPALTGFWIESSLLISPKEQSEVMERIFGEHTAYSPKTLEQLEAVMRVPEAGDAGLSIYGKTGMGKAHGVVVDAWFTGFADAAEHRVFFCVYLGRSGGENVSSTRTREIAIKILSEQYP